MPTVYLLHGLLGVFAIGLATIHKFLSFSMFPLIKDTGNIAWYLEIFLIIYAILFLSGWLVDRVALLRHAKGLLERHLFKHQVSLWIHRLNWVVVALIWLHVQLISRLDIPAFRLVFNLYTLMTILVYLWWKIRQRHGFQRGVVVTNEAIDNHLQSLTVQLTTNRRPYHAGDFYFIRFDHAFRGSGEEHPFSVASVPNQKNEVTFMVQRLGDYTDQVAQVPVGTKVKLEGPFGRFDQ